jgi:hypothetical protein
MSLAIQQRKLLGLLRSTYDATADDDPYIRTVAGSADLLEARRNILLWRVYVLERMCPLTFELLKLRGLLETTIDAFVSQRNISPFRETQAPDFLEMLGSYTDDLVASVAQFELALTRVRDGVSEEYVIPWKVEPHSILNSLARKTPLEDGVPTGDYRIVVSRDLPSLFEISQLT